MRSLRCWVIPLAFALLTGGCASVQVRDAVHHGALPWGLPSGQPLGRISVWPEVDWRPDQKEKPSREAMARTAIENTFQDFPHGRVTEIRPVAASSAASEQARLDEAKAAGVDTVVIVRVAELGPLLYLSIPVLWSTYSDVKFRLRVVSPASGEVLLDAERQRQVGGPFALRGTGPLTKELEIALREALGLPAR